MPSEACADATDARRSKTYTDHIRKLYLNRKFKFHLRFVHYFISYPALLLLSLFKIGLKL